MPDVGSFEDILAEARQQTAAPPAAGVAGAEALADPQAAVAALVEGTEGAHAGVAAEKDVAGLAGEDEDVSRDADELLIMGSEDDEEGSEGGGVAGVRLVELPSTLKKHRSRMPFIRTQVGGEEGGEGGSCCPCGTAGPRQAHCCCGRGCCAVQLCAAMCGVPFPNTEPLLLPQCGCRRMTLRSC